MQNPSALRKLGSRITKFIEVRVIAFIAALLVLVGFILGMIVHNSMALTAIAEFKQATNAAILREYGK